MDDEQQNALNAYTQCVEAVRHARQQIPQMWDSSDPAYVALAASLPSVPEMEALAEQVREGWRDGSTMTDSDDKAAEEFVTAYEEAVNRLLRAVSLGGSTTDHIKELLTSLTVGGPGPDMGRLMGTADEENRKAILRVLEGQAILGVHPRLDRWRVMNAA